MRLQLDLSESSAQLLNDLKNQTDARTYKDLFNNAMTLLGWAVRQRQKGLQIGSIDQDRNACVELHMQALESAASKRRATETIRGHQLNCLK